MNAELQTKLVEIITSIQAGVQAAGTFALEQLPDIAQSYVAFGRAYGTFLVLLGTGLFVSGLKFMLWCSRRGEAEDKEGYYVIAAFLGCPTVIAGLVVSLGNVKGALLVWFAPKVWLLLELAKLINPK